MGFYGSFIADTPKPLYNRIKRLKCAENERFRAFVRMRMRAYVPRVIFMVFPWWFWWCFLGVLRCKAKPM